MTSDWRLEIGDYEPTSSDLQSPISVFDGLESLVDKNLLRQAEAAGREMRFSMLETVREFALERLAESSEEGTLRQRHAEWVSAFAAAAAPEIIGPNQARWYGPVEAEMDNIRAAFDWLLARDEVERAGELAANLGRFWFRRGYWREGRDRLLLILARLSAVAAPGLRATLLWDAAGYVFWQDGYAAVLPLYRESETLGRQLEDQRPLMWTLAFWSLEAAFQGEIALALKLADEGLVLARRVGDQRAMIICLRNLGDIARIQGDLARAAAHYGEALAIAHQRQDHWLTADVTERVGTTAWRRGDAVTARVYLTEAIALFHQIGDRRGESMPRHRLADIAYREGDVTLARALLEQVIQEFRDVGDEVNLGPALQMLGDVARLQGDYDTAEAAYAEALALSEARNLDDGVAINQLNLGFVLLRRGDTARAGTLLQESLETRQALGDPHSLPLTVAALACLATAQARDTGQAEGAARLFAAAEALVATGDPVETVDQRELDHYRARLADFLDATALDAALVAGRAMTLEQAIADALGAEAA